MARKSILVVDDEKSQREILEMNRFLDVIKF